METEANTLNYIYLCCTIDITHIVRNILLVLLLFTILLLPTNLKQKSKNTNITHVHLNTKIKLSYFLLPLHTNLQTYTHTIFDSYFILSGHMFSYLERTSIQLQSLMPAFVLYKDLMASLKAYT